MLRLGPSHPTCRHMLSRYLQYCSSVDAGSGSNSRAKKRTFEALAEGTTQRHRQELHNLCMDADACSSFRDIYHEYGCERHGEDAGHLGQRQVRRQDAADCWDALQRQSDAMARRKKHGVREGGGNRASRAMKKPGSLREAEGKVTAADPAADPAAASRYHPLALSSDEEDEAPPMVSDEAGRRPSPSLSPGETRAREASASAESPPSPSSRGARHDVGASAAAAHLPVLARILTGAPCFVLYRRKVSGAWSNVCAIFALARGGEQMRYVEEQLPGRDASSVGRAVYGADPATTLVSKFQERADAAVPTASLDEWFSRKFEDAQLLGMATCDVALPRGAFHTEGSAVDLKALTGVLAEGAPSLYRTGPVFVIYKKLSSNTANAVTSIVGGAPIEVAVQGMTFVLNNFRDRVLYHRLPFPASDVAAGSEHVLDFGRQMRRGRPQEAVARLLSGLPREQVQEMEAQMPAGITVQSTLDDLHKLFEEMRTARR